MLKPKQFIPRDDEDESDYEYLERPWWSEDDQMEREQDIHDYYDDENESDDLTNVL